MEKSEKNKRANTRSVVWKDVVATVHVEDPFSSRGRTNLTVDGEVKDISAKGMFLLSRETVPLDSKATINIDFNSRKPGKILLKVEGKIVRRDEQGVAIEFTRIDLRRMQQCIMERMNDS